MKEYQYQKDDKTAAIRRRRELVMRMQDIKRLFFPDAEDSESVTKDKEDNNEKPSTKQKERVKELIQESVVKYKSEMEANPRFLFRIKAKKARRNWNALAQVLLDDYGIGKEENGKLRAYYENEMDEAGTFSEGTFAVYGRGEDERKKGNVNQSKSETSNISVPLSDKGDVKTGSEPQSGNANGPPATQDKSGGGDVTGGENDNAEVKTEVWETSTKEQRYSQEPRTDVKWNTPLTPEQEEKYHWKESLAQVTQANKGWDKYTLILYTRRLIQDGWDVNTDETPSLNNIYDREVDAEGRHVVESAGYASAFAYANKKKKEGDLTYNTFVWKHKVSGKQMISGTAYSSNTAYSNFLANKDKTPGIDFDSIAAFVGDEGKQYITKIKNIKAYNDKLLSQDFVNLVYKAQQKIWPEPENASKRTGVWDAETQKKFLSYDADQKLKEEKKKQAEQKQKDELAKGKVGTDGYWTGTREGRELTVHWQTWQDFKKIIQNNLDASDEFIEDYAPPRPQYKEDLACVLTASERERILFALAREIDVDESEEKIINLILRNTPPSQYIDMAKTIKWLETQYRMRSWFDHDETISEYSSLRTKIMGAFDKSNADTEDRKVANDAYESVDIKDNSEDAAEDLNKKMPSLSPEQIQKFVWYQRRALLNIFLGDDWPTDDIDWKYFDKLFINIPSYHLGLMKMYLEENNFLALVRMRDRLKSENASPGQVAAIDEALNDWYDSDYGWLKKLKMLANQTEKFDFVMAESMLYALPNSIYEKLTNDERLNLYKYVVYRGSNGTAKRQAHILEKILGTVSSDIKDNKNKEQYNQQRQTFYNKINNEADPYFSMLNASGMSDDEKEKITQMINGMDKEGRSQRIQIVKGQSREGYKSGGYSAYGGSVTSTADDKIASLSDEDMAALSFDERKGFIQDVVGRDRWDAFFTRVGGRDEQTLIRLIYTTPEIVDPKEKDQSRNTDMKKLMQWLAKDSGTMYYRLQSAIDGENFQKLHDTFSKKRFEQVENETDQEKKLAEKKKIDQMEKQGQQEGKSLPWDDYSFLGLLFFGEGIEYSVDFNDEGKITVSYENVSWVDVYFSSFTMGLSTLSKLKDQVGKQKTYNPWDLVPVYSKEDDKELGLQKGEVVVMPAINLFKYAHKQNMGHLWELVDIVTLAIGIGELKAAVSLGRWLMAAADVFVSAGNMVNRTFGDKLPSELTKGWTELSGEIMTFQFLYIGKQALTGLRDIKSKLQTLRTTVRNLPATVKGAVKTMYNKFIDMVDEMLEEGERMMRGDRNYLAKKLEELEAGKADMIRTPEGLQAYNNIRKFLTERISIMDEEAKFGKLPENVKESPVSTIKQLEKPKLVGAGGSKTQWRMRFEGNSEKETVTITMQDGKPYTFTRKPGETTWKAVENDEMANRLKSELDAEGPQKMKERIESGDVLAGKKVGRTGGEVYPKEKFDELKKYLKDRDVEVISGDEAKAMLDKHNANALYVPGAPGKPGKMYFRENPSRIEVLEELVHYGQHKKLGFAQISREELIELELAAQDKMLMWAEKKGWSKELKDRLESAREEWDELKSKLEGGKNEVDVLNQVEIVFASKKVVKNSAKFTTKEIDDLIAKLESNAKFDLEGTGPYLPNTKGHHPLAKAGFSGDLKYDYKKAFTVSKRKLEEYAGVGAHASITGNQISLYSAFGNLKPKQILTLDKMSEIEIKAMTMVGIPQDIATGWVVKALEDLKLQSVTEITNIPWKGINKL